MKRGFAKAGYEFKGNMMDLGFFSKTFCTIWSYRSGFLKTQNFQCRRWIFTVWMESSDLPVQRLQSLSGHVTDILATVYNRPTSETMKRQHKQIRNAYGSVVFLLEKAEFFVLTAFNRWQSADKIFETSNDDINEDNNVDSNKLETYSEFRNESTKPKVLHEILILMVEFIWIIVKHSQMKMLMLPNQKCSDSLQQT